MTEIYPYTEVNLHTHFFMCGHATGEASEYVDQALGTRLKVLGFSDHCPLPDHSYSGSRMDIARLGQYVDYVNEQKERRARGLKILLGAECDYRPDLAGFYRDLGFDYLICSVHYANSHRYISYYRNSPDMLHEYTDNYIAALQSGLFILGCHPDLFGLFYLDWDAEARSCAKAIIEASQDSGVALEINGYGLRKPLLSTPGGLRHQYPLDPFWELAAELGGVKTVVNSDAHRPEDIIAKVDEGYEMASRLGLKVPSLVIDNSVISLK